MAFIEPQNVFYGISELPARLYGGIVYSSERINNCISQNNFIPLHNTSLFRKRDLLFPRSITCPVPICQIPSTSYETEVKRLIRTPSDIYLKPEYVTKEQNRNLMSGETTSEDSVRLWFVDDNSDRKVLNEIIFRFDVPLDPHLPIRLNRDDNSWEWATKFDLPSSALELQAYDQFEQSNKVFVRTEDKLSLYNSSTSELSDVFKWPVKYFERVAYMDEVAVVNNDGMVFYGQIGSEEFSRVKSADKIISVVSTDSPANLILVSKSNIFQADIRTHSSNLDTIFDFNKDNWKLVDPISDYGINYLKDRERIWHVNCVRPETETYLVTTTQRIYTLDLRMPNLPLFYTNHFNFNGGEYCITKGPFTHSELEMDVYQYFSLSRILHTGVTHWAIGWNKKESIWTSMGSNCRLDSPNDVLNLCRSQSHLPSLDENIRNAIPDAALAMHYQQFPENVRSDENRALFFRQMNNGQIWFDSINFAKPKAYCSHEGAEKEPEETIKSVEEIIKFFNKPTRLNTFWEFVDDNVMVSLSSKLKPFDYPTMMGKLTANLDKWEALVDDDDESHELELDDINALLVPTPNDEHDEIDPPLKVPPSDEHTFSKIIINMAAKAKKWMEEADNELVYDEEQIEDEEQVEDEEEPQPSTSSYDPYKSFKQSQHDDDILFKKPLDL